MPKRKLSRDEIIEHILEGMCNLETFCQIYDGGRPYIVFAMATEIHRCLCGNAVAIELANQRTFRTSAGPSLHNLADQLKDIKLRINLSGTYPDAMERMDVTYEPIVRDDPVELSFDVWWGRDLVYLEGGIAEDFTLKPERAFVTRIGLVKMMRDKLGAHLDDALPEYLDKLQGSMAFGIDFHVDMERPDGSIDRLSVGDGTLPMRISPAAAMMRAIAADVLAAYSTELAAKKNVGR